MKTKKTNNPQAPKSKVFNKRNNLQISKVFKKQDWYSEKKEKKSMHMDILRDEQLVGHIPTFSTRSLELSIEDFSYTRYRIGNQQ